MSLIQESTGPIRGHRLSNDFFSSLLKLLRVPVFAPCPACIKYRDSSPRTEDTVHSFFYKNA